MAFRRIYKLLLAWNFIFLLLTVSSLQCGHGIRGSGRRMRPEKIKPLVFKQHVPNVSEGTLGASGQSEGKITRNSPKFKELVTMDDPNIVFRDEEGDGSDRLMSKRCKDKLKSLSIAVMNHWPGIKLRVTEAWDDKLTHAKDSLHYEGRAVDITTSDKDRSKYPMLASLAVAAGFDWVYYESRGHIHCSVKSDNSEAIKRGGGCFPGDVKIRTQSGQTKNMSSLQVGERVLTMTDEGKLVYSEVIMFMDRNTKSKAVYKKLILDSGKYLMLTADHLVYVSTSGHHDVDGDFHEAVVEFASNVKVGDYVRAVASGEVIASKVVDIQTETKDGVYAPLTLQGTIVANDVVASCYAVVNSHALAHSVFAPVRFIHNLKDYFGIRGMDSGATTESSEGINWYPNIFHKIAPYVLNKNMFLKL